MGIVTIGVHAGMRATKGPLSGGFVAMIAVPVKPFQGFVGLRLGQLWASIRIWNGNG